MRRIRPLVLGALCASACSSGLRVDTVWRPEDPGEHPALIGTIGDDAIIVRDGRLERIGVLDRTLRWRSDATTGWSFMPTFSGDDLVILGESAHTDQITIQRIDVGDGTVKSRAPHASSSDQWARYGDALYLVSAYAVTRVDLTTGTALWTTKASFIVYDTIAAPTVVWVECDRGLCGLSAATGAEVGTVPATNWPRLTPDGRSLVLALGSEIQIRDAATGAVTRAISVPTGHSVERVVVTDRWIAGPSRHGGLEPRTVLVFGRADGALAWRRTTRSGAYVEYFGASGDLVVYYDSSDATFNAVHLPDRTIGKFAKQFETFVMSTDATGMAPAVPDEDPVVLGDYVFIKNFDKITGYRVRR